METITIKILRTEVYDEVSKATDYTGAKLIDSDDTARDRILAGDDDLATLGRFWDEAVLATNESLKEMLVSSTDTGESYTAVLEVSKSFDKVLTQSVVSTLRSFFISSIIGQWFKFANKGEASEYFTQASEMMDGAERLLYSRRKPMRPTD